MESFFNESRKRGEQREVIAIDGTPAKKKAKLPKNLKSYNYLPSKPSEPGRIVLQFETKKDQTYFKWTLNGETRPAGDTGEAWIDPGSMQVVHLERHFLNLPRSLPRLDMTADYGPVTIDEKQSWLPKSFRAEGGKPEPRGKPGRSCILPNSPIAGSSARRSGLSRSN